MIEKVLTKLGDILSHAWGWVLLVCGSAFNVIAGYQAAITLVTFVIIGDLIFGIMAARKQGKYAQSELIRSTFHKVGAYYFVLLVAVMIEQVVHWDWFMATDFFATIIAITELWSIAGNILIINPRAPIFKLMRSALVGEIARKLGRTESEVKQAFEHDDDESQEQAGGVSE